MKRSLKEKKRFRDFNELLDVKEHEHIQGHVRLPCILVLHVTVLN